ncbi:hypothetical protein POSPLADRAFT_1144611 [Postia placenta MAD-698-R-SB12]|uniref:Uncharacterized protein n=1 Tax=Postia placenta MAD-698-R-SB12 TaxID=670580 RepID=A0A1X6MYK8_9APHY|nr:hypothetical protein POSPLADRAFT_1144611 [Postia placenta MAD-698-R-SB12]OSX61461.1 hypothetical protein POSPLADRAFT_1144611 [Postia placenta MAD-698-R-SB12]
MSIAIKKAQSNLHLELNGCQHRVDQPFFHHIIGGVGVLVPPSPEGTLGRTLPAMRGTEDCPRAKATIVTVHQANFKRSKCLSSLAAAMVVEATEEVGRWGDV